ncbi:ESPR-type extended signal peptide-containing protein [uncultured Phascolarctobacterium sp.]|uniref:ESPR-type extended signal peptide-containing protein n=1 Tax=uncultured Phascolarctobacterium sp. TaxID=512296 RepID=UPI0027DD2F3C|nr:ESPR-type extended signal peptide-containing protein [uncultured Phascolarctobacterium sp.]
MNKVFKVIWNEARNAYVVVSEIAKNRGSKSCSTKKLLAMLIATGVMTCASFDVLAAEPTAAETAQFQYVAFYDETADLINGQDKLFGGHKYVYDATNKYWVREGYVLVVEKNGKLHTPLSANGKSADVLYTGGGDTGSILQSVASTVSANGTVTNMGESLNRITASAFAGVSHGGGTAVAGDWAYIIQDSSWKDSVAPENYKDGYADLIDKDNGMPKGFKTAEDPNTELNWDATKQAYTYKGKPVDYSNVYVINGKIGVFTNKDGSEVYKGTVFGKNNEILMTVKDANNHFYSYWASEVTDPSATMQSYRMTEYKKDLSVLEQNDNKLHRDDIKEVTMTTDASTNSAIIGLVRNGNTEAGASVKGAITVTSGGGTGGQDTFVKISNDTANQTFATGSKVEAIGTPGATTGFKINGVDYTITDNDTTYTAGENVTIDSDHKISVNLSEYAKKTDAAVVYNDKNSLHSTNSGNVGEKAIAFGKNTIADGKSSVAIGDGANVDANNVYTSSGNYSTAVGAASGAWGTQTTAVGYNAQAKGQNAVALGFSASASATDSVAIGANSVANREAGSVGLYAPTGNSSSTWKATSGAISIGSSTKTRQIINLAAGTADTDAVNVAQLKKVNAEAEKHTTLVAGANVTLDKKETESGLQYTISAIGGSNYQAGNGIAIEAENNTISVKLNDAEQNLVVNSNGLALKKNLTGMQSIQGAGEGKISFDGANVKVNNTTFGENNVVVGVAGDGKSPVQINGESGEITGLNNTKVGYTDFAVNKGKAATEGQLKQVMDEGWKFTTDSGNKTTVKVGPDGTNDNAVTFKGDGTNIAVTNTGKDIKVELKKDLTGLTSVTTNNAYVTNVDNNNNNSVTNVQYVNEQIAGVTLTEGNGISITDKKINVKLNNAEKNLVVDSNGLALNTALTGIQSITGAGAGSISFADGGIKLNNKVTIDNTGKITGVADGTDEKDAVNFGQLDATNKKVDNLTTEVGKGWTVATDNGTATKVGAGDTVKFSGADDNIKVSNDGKDVKVELNKNLTGIQSINGTGAGSISFADGGIKLNNKVTIDNTGKITGVADGTIAAGSTDAVNGSQLNDIKNSINTDISNKTFGLKDDKGSEVTSTLGNTVQVKGADGITSTVKDGALEIGLKLQDNSNLVVNSNGLALNTALTGIQSINGAGGTINLAGSAITINETTFNKDGRIQNVADGTETKDAVNFGQLDATNKKVDNLTTEVGKGWTVATDNGTATKVGAGDTVKFSGADDNIKVSNDGKDVKVELNKNLTGIQSINGNSAGSISFADGDIKLNNKVTIDNTGKITGVAAGTNDSDAVNVSQLNAVKAEASKKTTLSDGKNTTVTSVTTDGQTDYKVNVAGDLKDITSVANGASEIKLNADSIIIANTNKTFAITNSGIGMSYITADYSAKSIMLGENGTTISGGLNVAGSKITGVAAGEANTDAVNVGQLNTVKNELQTSDKRLVTNQASTDGSYKPDANGNISLRVEDQNKNGFNVVIKDVASKAELGEVANRVTNVENKVTQIETDVTNIKTDITNIKSDVTNIKNDITDINTRVDKVEALAGKHTTLEKNGNNINVEETEVDGQKNYKVNLNEDIMLGDENGKNVSISGTNGTITATGDITTANRINADKGGKLADIDVTGNKLSNGSSSITLDGTNVKVNDKVTVDKDGKISGVAKGDISNTSTDAVNDSQLYDTNTHITNVENQVISNSNRIGQLSSRVNKVGAGAAALAALHSMDFDPDDKLTFSAGYGNYAGQNAAAIGAYYRPDEKVMFSVGGTVGNGENMVNAGISFSLDRTNHVSNSRTALAREVIELRGQLAEMGAKMAKMAKMEKAFGMLDESKTKLFPDIPANHWAYEYIAKLAGNGYIEGYPDGNFGGDRLMTRYEFAAMLYRAIENGAALEEKIIKEFEPELGRIRVDRISGEDGNRDKIERVRVNDTKGERDHYGNKLAK